MLELSETHEVPWVARWLKKHNQLKHFCQKQGHTKVTFSNCGDKSLVIWARAQRRCCEIECRIEQLNAVEFNWCPSEALLI